MIRNHPEITIPMKLRVQEVIAGPWGTYQGIVASRTMKRREALREYARAGVIVILLAAVWIIFTR